MQKPFLSELCSALIDRQLFPPLLSSLPYLLILTYNRASDRSDLRAMEVQVGAAAGVSSSWGC